MFLIKKFNYLFLIFFILGSSLLFAGNSNNTKAFIASQYQKLLENNKSLLSKAALPSQSVFELAMTGYLNLKESEQLAKAKYLSIVDFSLASTEKRFWLVNLGNSKIIYHSLVAHGRNTGQNMAKYFSNKLSSYQSSIGFYITGGTYHGKHGLSLYLHGKDKGYNDQAKKRAIVIHGADYVSEQFIKMHGRLGRSLGCPALPMSNYKEIISTIAGGTCLFVYYPSNEYVKKSTVLTENRKLNVSSSFLAEE